MATKRVNIYIDEKAKAYYKNLQNKYHVSLSTIASEIYFSYCALGCQKKLEEKYLILSGTSKTSIKPKLKGYTPSKPDMAFTNALLIFQKKYECEMLGLERHQYEIVRDKIHKFLQEARDTYWMYNDTIRNQRRSLRDNKEYFKKALEQ